MLGDFYLRECFYNYKTIDFFQIFSNFAVGSQNLPVTVTKLKYM